MAVRTWANTLGIGAGAGLLTGAGQLGIGYGLGILRWPEFPSSEAWHAQLTWIAFLSVVAVVAGGYAGLWHARRMRLSPTPAVRAALALTAGVGAAIVLPLVIRPAAASHPAEGGDPRLSVALTAAAGLLIGVIAAFAALTVPAVSGNLVTTILWVWIVALICATSTLSSGAAWATARLGLFSTHGIWVPLALLLPAVLIALAVAGIARFGGSDPRAVGACGATGPALVGLAYLIAGPGTAAGANAYRWALVAIALGGAVSVGVAVARRRPAPATAPAPAGIAPPPATTPDAATTTEPGTAPLPAEAAAPAETAGPATPLPATPPPAEEPAPAATEATTWEPAPTWLPTTEPTRTEPGRTEPARTALGEADPPEGADPPDVTLATSATETGPAAATVPARPWFRRIGRRKERPAAPTPDAAAEPAATARGEARTWREPAPTTAGPAQATPEAAETASEPRHFGRDETGPGVQDPIVGPAPEVDALATKPKRTRRAARSAVKEAPPEPVAAGPDEAFGAPAEPGEAPAQAPAPASGRGPGPDRQPAKETAPRRRTGLGRRKRDGAEPEVRDPDGHLDWVKALRDDEPDPPPA